MIRICGRILITTHDDQSSARPTRVCERSVARYAPGAVPRGDGTSFFLTKDVPYNKIFVIFVVKQLSMLRYRTLVNAGLGNPRRQTHTTPCCIPSLERARYLAERFLTHGTHPSYHRTYSRYHRSIYPLSNFQGSLANTVVDIVPPSSTPTDWRGNHTNENTTGSPRHQT